MSNTYFRFKQFTIHQDKCAMKVSTDACILGAWLKLRKDTRLLLDVGAGTGLLSLMLAQRYHELQIDAIELDEHAALQARENVINTPWAERINVLQTDANSYAYEHKYDCIIANPPFFNNSLLGDNEQRNRARHTVSLTYGDLFTIIKNNLSINGFSAVLLPVTGLDIWEAILREHDWHVSTKLLVHPRVGQPANRVIVTCVNNAAVPFAEEHIYIRNADNSYTDEFTTLMQPYYLG